VPLRAPFRPRRPGVLPSRPSRPFPLDPATDPPRSPPSRAGGLARLTVPSSRARRPGRGSTTPTKTTLSLQTNASLVRVVAASSLFANLILIALLVVVSVAVTRPRAPAAPTSSSTLAPEHVSTLTGGAVAADEPRCSRVGADVLADGGAAADAAVAAALCLGVLHPHSSGVGGGAFALVRRTEASGWENPEFPGSTWDAIDFREIAPGLSTRDMFLEADGERRDGDGDEDGGPTTSPSVFGALAVAAPTELFGLRKLWERHGTLPWARLVAPAAELAEGFAIGPDLAREIAKEADKGFLARDPTAREMFFRGGDHRAPKREGETCANPLLASTLRLVAREGPGVLARGPLAESLAADVGEAGGILRVSDLAAAEASVRFFMPLTSRAFGYEIHGMPPPSSGGAAVGQILQFLSQFPELSLGPPLASAGALGWHRLAEACKHAFALRMNLGDPGFDWPGENLTGAIRDMLDPGFNRALIESRYDDDRTQPDARAYGARWNQLDDSGTTHVSVVDGRGDAVALTSTINTAFGSKFYSKSTGILLNNEMDDFSSPGEANNYGLAPSEANYIEPHKRPLSSMSPTIVTRRRGARSSANRDAEEEEEAGEERLVAVAGASGGPRIITSVAQILLNALVRGMSPLDAVNAPRVHHQLTPNVAFAENQTAVGGGGRSSSSSSRGGGTSGGDSRERKFAEADAEALRRRGHEVRYTSALTATTQLIVVDEETGRVHAVSDARKGGRPATEEEARANRLVR